MKSKLLLFALLLMGVSVGAQTQIFPVYISDDCSTNGKNGDTRPVDLGLSVKWANMNVGASYPEDYGNHYAWGEVTTKSNYTWGTYLWCNGSHDRQTKYCTNSSYGTVDNKATLESADDVVHVNWGGAWRMPTDAEWGELLNQCTWTWTTQNGVKGYRVTATNGNSIFLPAAGFRYSRDLYNDGFEGNYWSSSLSTINSYSASIVGFKSSFIGRPSGLRSNGMSVRPVAP